MNSVDPVPPPRRDIFSAAGAIFRFLASTQLAVALIVMLAIVLAMATILETSHGHAYVLWYVYESSWFFALLVMLGINILAATIARFPWRRKIPFLVTHIGLLLLLAGAMQSFLGGVEGQLSITEGTTATEMLVPDVNRIETRWQVTPGQHARPKGIFTFKPGPVDWSDKHGPLDLGAIDGVSLRVLKYYSHAKSEELFLPETGADTGPALQVALVGPDGTTVSESWFGAEQAMNFGPLELRLQQATEGTILEDFLRAPPKNTDPDGVLSMHYRGKMIRVPVSKNVGKKVSVGDSGIEVEIVAYYPDARPDSGGRFSSASKTPKNPLLELRVQTAKGQEPLREIAAAKLPLLSLDAVFGRNCPVKFWYHHPAVAPRAGVEFLQTPDGNLACRTQTSSGLTIQEHVQVGDRMALTAGFKVAVLKYLPHARQEFRFHPQELPPGESEGAEGAALVEVAIGEGVQRVWLKRGDPDLGQQMITTPEGTLTVTFKYETRPLGFSLQLLKFKRGRNPGGMGDASFASSVRLIDNETGLNETREISMNEPLTHRRLTFYQSSFQETDDARPTSVLSVAADPGLMLKYLGSLMICGGSAVMFIVRSWRMRSARNGRDAADNASPDATENAQSAPQYEGADVAQFP